MPTAFVLIKCEGGAERKIMKSLDKTDVTWDVQPTIGQYDLIAKIASPSLEELNEVIRKVHRDDRVRSTKVLLGMTEAAEAA
jgi:DNA-binding Lrp family transcriptional regulator